MLEIPIDEEAIRRYAEDKALAVRGGNVYILCPHCGAECKAEVLLRAEDDDEEGPDSVLMPRISFGPESTIQLHVDIEAHVHDHECGQIIALQAAVRKEFG